jgi:MFS transporter, DHA1 family, multidrug resistance protein
MITPYIARKNMKQQPEYSKNTITAALLLSVMTVIFSTDIYIPSLPEMREYFSCSLKTIQFTITAGVLGGTFFTIILGPLADAWGRKKLFIGFHLVYTTASIAAIFSPTVEFLIIARFFQGVGATAAMVLSFAIIADIYSGVDIPIRFGYITSTITSSLVLAPILGGLLADYYSWQASFILLSTLGVLSLIPLLLFLPETLKTKTNFSLKKTTKTYFNILKHPSFILMTMKPSLMIGCIIAFTAIASFYYQNQLGIEMREFGFYQSIIMVFNTIFTYVAGRSIKKYGLPQTISNGFVIFVIGGITFFLTTVFYPQSPIILTACVSIYSGGIGYLFAAITAESMALFPNTSGATSALIALIRGAIIALCIFIASWLYDKFDGAIISIGFFVLAIIFICLLMYFPTIKALRNKSN